MPEIFTMIVALLAAVGVVALGWLFLGAWPRNGTAPPAIAILHLTDRAADVQQAVCRLQYLRQWGPVKILLADGGMTVDVQKQVTILLRDDPSIVLCGEDEVQQYMIKDMEN